MHNEICQAEAQVRQERMVTQDSLLKVLSRPLRILSFIRSKDSIANGALVIARLLLVIGARPEGREA